MRLSWRLLRIRARIGSCSRGSVQHFLSDIQSQPNLGSIRSFTSLLHGNLCPSHPILSFHFADSRDPRNPSFHRFSSEAESESESESKESDHSVVWEIFGEPRSSEEIKKGLEGNNVVISHDWALEVLKKLESSPDVARRFFDWVSENEEKILSSKSYNLMLRILGVNGLVSEFWGLNEVMKKKGYGISKGVRDVVLDKFKKAGTISDVKKLKHVFDSGSIDNSDGKIALRASRIIRNNVWSDDVEKQLRDLNATFSSDMVKTVLDSIGTDPAKGLLFFRWIEESGLFKHDEKTYNAVAKVLGREDCYTSFDKVIGEMEISNFEMDRDTFAIILGRFCKRRMTEAAVNLYEFAMIGPNNKPSVDCGVFLLKKIAVAPKFCMVYFIGVLKSLTKNGIALTDSMFKAVLKSLNSVNKVEVAPKVLMVMEEYGYVASDNMLRKLVFLLCVTRRNNEAVKFVDELEASRNNHNWKVRTSLIQGLCSIGELKMVSDCIQKMVANETLYAASPLDSIVAAYCKKNKATEAYELLHQLATEKQVKPWHTTYQVLITTLLAQRGFSNAVNLLGLMKSRGFPPFVDPFVEYLSKVGTGDEAIAFMTATSKRVASDSLFLQVFEAYFKAGRRNEAQNFLLKCPSSIRNHPDVLNLFANVKPKKVAATAPLAA